MYKRKGIYKRKRNPEDKINLLLGSFLVVVIVPVFLITLLGKIEFEDLLSSSAKNVKSKVEAELPLVVAKQISIHMPEEVIKAQSVIARTQILAAEENGKLSPSSFSLPDLQELWGDYFDEYYDEKLSVEKLQEMSVSIMDNIYSVDKAVCGK